VLHAHEMKIHVVAASNPNGNAAVNNPSGAASTGPVVIPSPPNDNSAMPNPGVPDTSSENIQAPIDNDGRPAKVFMVLTPATTDAYVGQTIALKIEFFIRMDSIAQQDSLPTIKGIDFLMNDLSVRPEEDELAIANEPYHRETWNTAISAPKSGDFPLQMLRDTYWTREARGVFSDPLGNFFGPRPDLEHGNVPSNELTIHVHPLPDEGRPADFTGAIGQFQATGNASPLSVGVGEPIYLDFKISGEGSFDRVRCPVIPADPAWKIYPPSSKITFDDESHTQGNKTFREAVIPQKNGALTLPAASFSYFDPAAKKYVALSIDLPPVTVTGTPAPVVAASAPADNSSPGAPATDTTGLLPNRLDFGDLHPDLTPAFRQPWFWAVQGAALLVIVLALPLARAHARRRRDDVRAERARQRRSLRELEQAMHAAVAQGDAPTFFAAARQALQMQWGAAWGLRPEAVTLPLIAERDPELAARLSPFFAQADEIHYSGRAAGGDLDLAAWERQVREEMQQLQPV
jgi:hypothetical protein